MRPRVKKTRKRLITPTEKQHECLAYIRTTLAEEGYKIFPVSTPFQKSAIDFVAAPTGAHSIVDAPDILLVRIAHKNVVTINPYTDASVNKMIRVLLDATLPDHCIVEWRAQLRRSKQFGEWTRYINRSQHGELKLLYNIAF